MMSMFGWGVPGAKAVYSLFYTTTGTVYSIAQRIHAGGGKLKRETKKEEEILTAGARKS